MNVVTLYVVFLNRDNQTLPYQIFGFIYIDHFNYEKNMNLFISVRYLLY